MPQEKVNDLKFPDGQREEINLLHGVDLHVLNQAAQFGDGDPLLFLSLDSENSVDSALVTDATTEASRSQHGLPPRLPRDSGTSSSTQNHPLFGVFSVFLLSLSIALSFLKSLNSSIVTGEVKLSLTQVYHSAYSSQK